MGTASSQPIPFTPSQNGRGDNLSDRGVPGSPSTQPARTQGIRSKHKKLPKDATETIPTEQKPYKSEMNEKNSQEEAVKNDQEKKPKARKTGHMRPQSSNEEPIQSLATKTPATPGFEQPMLHDTRKDTKEKHDVSSPLPDRTKPTRKRRKDHMTVDTVEETGIVAKRPRLNGVSPTARHRSGDIQASRAEVNANADKNGSTMGEARSNGSTRAAKETRKKTRKSVDHGNNSRTEVTKIVGIQANKDRDRDQSQRTRTVRREPATIAPSGAESDAIDFSQKHSLDDGPSKGKFDEEEIQLLDTIFEDCRQEQGKSEYEMRALIEDWSNLVDFKTAIESALPNRKKTALRKFCKRHFATHNRGPWTKADDEELLAAYQKYPNSWNQIADFVNRNGDSCRSRYKNHLRLGAAKKTGAWSQNEESKFVKVVSECLATIAADLDEESESKPQQLINFAVVSQKMGDRSEQRCRDKWHQLESRGHVTIESSGHAVLLPFRQSSYKHVDDLGTSKDVRPVLRQIDSFKDGDFYDLLTEIHTSFQNHDEQWHDESTMWSEIARMNAGSKFAMPRLRRLGYYAALKKYDRRKKITKQALSAAATALLLAREIESIAETHKAPMSRTYSAQVWTTRSASMSDSRRSFKSPEYIVDSNAPTPEDVISSDGEARQEDTRTVVKEVDSDEQEHPLADDSGHARVKVEEESEVDSTSDEDDEHNELSDAKADAKPHMSHLDIVLPEQETTDEDRDDDDDDDNDESSEEESSNSDSS